MKKMHKYFVLVFMLCLATLTLVTSLLLPSDHARAANVKYDIGVFYFTNWNPELSPWMTANTEEIYGRTGDWFGGIKDHLTNPGPWGYGPIPFREPLLGWYDDRQQNVIDQHILQASSRGIDHFAFYYYWNYNGGGERPGQNAIYNFETSRYKHLMHFYIDFITDGNWGVDDWNNLIVPKLVAFMQDSSYKRTADGRPIVAFFGDLYSHFGNSAGVQTALQSLRTAAQNAGLQNPLLLLNAYDEATLTTHIVDEGFDGFLPLNLAGLGIHSVGTPEDYQTSYPVAWPDFVTRYEPYLFVPGGLSAFDARPWRGVSYSNNSTGENYVYADPSPQKFRAQLLNIKNYLDTHPSSMNMATIYAWNELGEGGAIEPTSLHRFGYLNAMQEVFNLDNSAYKRRVNHDNLTDLDPGLRLEIEPDYSTVTDGQVMKIIGKVTNNFDNAISSGTISLDTGGWTIVSASGTSLDGLASKASRDFEIEVQVGDEALWTKHAMTASASYQISGQNGNESLSTFVVKAPKVNGVIEPLNRGGSEPLAAFAGETVDLQVNVRDYSLDAQSGTYVINAPAGWIVSDGGVGSFSLSGYAGGVHANRTSSNTFRLKIPEDAVAGSYDLKINVTSADTTTESHTSIKIIDSYLRNGSFEVDSDSDGLADYWQRMGTGTFSLSADAQDGVQSQKIVANGYGNGILQEWFVPEPNKRYTVEAWIKVESGRIRVAEEEADAGFSHFLGTNEYRDLTASSSWQNVTFSYTPKPDAAYMSIRFKTWDPGETIADVDHVVFKPEVTNALSPGITTLISSDSNGFVGNDTNNYSPPAITSDNRYTIFSSSASNLINNDTNQAADIFMKDNQTGETRRLSTNSDTDPNLAQANGASDRPSVSDDGHFVAFRSLASNLVAGDANNAWDVFRKDTWTGDIIRVSVNSAGEEANNQTDITSGWNAISADGRYVAFSSSATNLVDDDSDGVYDDDTNGKVDIFVRDTCTGAPDPCTSSTSRVSTDAVGNQAMGGDSLKPDISADGRLVVFRSLASNLVPGDTNSQGDIFVKDINNNSIECVSMNSDGNSITPSISDDGKWVTYASDATNLVNGDNNGKKDVFLAGPLLNDSGQLINGQITRVSTDSSENESSGGDSGQPVISGNGRYVAFYSAATNLDPKDTNGVWDVFRKDTQTHMTTRYSTTSNKIQGNGDSYFPGISVDGDYIAFISNASSLVAGDTNGTWDAFLASKTEE